MKGVLWLVVGTAVGLLVAQRLRSSEGPGFLMSVDAKTREFGRAVAESYRAREAELRAAIADADADARGSVSAH